jgi:hypothetical protein
MITQSPGKTFLLAGIALAGLALGSVVAPVHAGSITYVTPPGSTVPPSPGQPVSASATFTTSLHSLTIVLTDLLANPKDVGQLLSDLSFTLGNGGSLTGASLSSSSGQVITVASNGTFTAGPTVATGWVPTLGGTSGHLDDLVGTGHAGPAHTIIGPPGPGGTYSAVNNSIKGNGPHNPFLNQSATFTITGAGITADTTITSATFSFGTASGVTVAGVSVPEPSAVVICLTGMSLAGIIGICRSRRRGRSVGG